MTTPNPVDAMQPNLDLALLLSRRQLTELVYDAVNLEGINFTLPEVQTLLDGVTIGGHKLSDQTIALNQAEAWDYLFKAIENSSFTVDKTFACNLHAIASKEETLESGKFRSGNVTIAGTDYMPPKAETLDDEWLQMINHISNINNIFERAFAVFLQMARNQFFYDVNKRMGRFMMNGILLQAGYPVINVPVKRKLEFNENMLTFYESNDMQPMMTFLFSCIDPRIVEIMSQQND